MSKETKVMNEQIESEEEENMPEKKKRTIGTKLTMLKKGADTTDLKIGHLTNIGEIGLESEEIDITTHDSVDDFKEYIAGSKDAGEVSIEGYLFNESNFEKLLELANSREVRSWKVQYPSGATWMFDAFVKSLKDGAKDIEGVASFTMNLRISGAPKFEKSI
ncbi:phage tail tube protein [Erysipelothrix urinaevulpis]|uniref:phage tail tube protein n=1 Tax=Erysipelothrix urinaevulpis TaxID=2683717 RepID=UPI001359F4A3|nr:phage tail tube protein [Erysipelothrix urinaevulpis]